MHEPAVALTDFGLAIECAVFATLAARRLTRGSYRAWVLVFFVSIALGGLLGGMAHAWFYGDTTSAKAVWVATMVAIGVTATASWVLGAEIIGRKWYPLRILVAISFFAYTALIQYGWRSYRVVIAYYLPAALFMLLCAVKAAWKGQRNHRWTAVGLVLTFVAAGIQVMHFGIPGLGHNALYHVVQAGALLLIFVGLTFTKSSTTVSSPTQ